MDLYKGPLWTASLKTWGIINGRSEDAQLWILSAGHGLINSKDKIIPYDVTFQDPRDGVPSVLTRIVTEVDSETKRKALQAWWHLLIKSKSKTPVSLEELIGGAGNDDYFLVILSKDYLDATFIDLEKALKAVRYPEQIAIISNNVNDPLAKRLKPNWLYADSRFVNLQGSNNTLVNAKIAWEVLWHMFQEREGLAWWSVENFNNYLHHLSADLPSPKRPIREPSTDAQVEQFIRTELEQRETPFSRLHRKYRDSGRACEYTRFRGLYYGVKDELKSLALAKRPSLPVRHKPRKTKMLFFLPDWDDRVDPVFDFEKDEVTPNRDPYKHDAYHYELYGSLNCDGILVSKSVLEQNSQKKERVQASGIHQYLRVPKNVPVLGDCGAFNYISEKDPPYETEEILNYYDTFGFNLGVSIDHLIVPGILRRNNYYKMTEDGWIEITEDEFKNYKDAPNTLIKKSRNRHSQQELFLSENVIVEEEYLDEKERQRRYELTINNAMEFIEGHRKENLSFTPIGAVQGWDPESYASAVREYEKMGYSYVALGGLVRSTTEEILAVLENIRRVKKASTKLHVFGVARLDAIKAFMDFDVASVDSAGMLRQAWLSYSSNYYSPNMNHYTAIRIPPSDRSVAAKKAIETGELSVEKLRSLETECLSLLRQFDNDDLALTEVLDSVMAYERVLGGSGNLTKEYTRILSDRPWKSCQCKLCKDVGIDIVVFRRNNRNRRRGFHNTWVFFNKFKELTETS
jgi:queuine/archaeosine tRNA-ribosyltransferase